MTNPEIGHRHGSARSDCFKLSTAEVANGVQLSLYGSELIAARRSIAPPRACAHHDFHFDGRAGDRLRNSAF
jgi:hypothetical protein